MDLNYLIDNFEKILKRTLLEDIEIRNLPSPDIPLIMVDAGQIEQVLINLEVNAADAMPEGGKLTIETASVEVDDSFVAIHPDSKPGKYVVLAARDTGYGIGRDQLNSYLRAVFFHKGRTVDRPWACHGTWHH